MERHGTPEASSDSDYYESPPSSHPSSAHSSTKRSSKSGVFHDVYSVESSPIHARHPPHHTQHTHYTSSHTYSRPHHHPYHRSPEGRYTYTARPSNSYLPSTTARPVGQSLTLDQACEYQSSRQPYNNSEEDEIDDDIEILDGPPDLSPTRAKSFVDRNYTWKADGEGGDTDAGTGGDSADDMEVVTPSTSMHSIPRVNKYSSPPSRDAGKYSEEMVDAAIALCGLGSVHC